MSKDWDEEKLIREAQKNSHKFEPLFELYFERIFRFFFSRTYDRPTAEDLTSQTFLKIIQALPHYKSKGSFAAWIFTIARNTLNSHYRLAENRLNHNLDEDNISKFNDQKTPQRQFTDLENKIDLNRALRRLSHKDQEILSLRYAAELSYEDIAVILRKKPGAVKMAIHRTLKKVQELMESDHEK